ncbi:hypothetical protein WMW72_06875 [Paenibacillus filicis]|uniref:Lipoprotein n=1 Tax=Paenibacillus filicis TaxID=669464 RepID=A0ABU9DHU3_9BACL
MKHLGVLMLVAGLLIGCTHVSSEKVGETSPPGQEILERQPLPPLPDTIRPSFEPLTMNELQKGEPSPEWQLRQSIPFGQIGPSEGMLHIYEASSPDELLSSSVHGILSLPGGEYLLRDLSRSFLEQRQPGCDEVCLFQRVLPGQERVELIGSIELFANGPGLHANVVDDRDERKLQVFDNWGQVVFVDLDQDGSDELIIQFQGLHNSPPDVFFIRATEGVLEKSESVVTALGRNSWDFARLEQERTPPVISIGNVWTEAELVYAYTYRQGVLERVP